MYQLIKLLTTKHFLCQGNEYFALDAYGKSHVTSIKWSFSQTSFAAPFKLNDPKPGGMSLHFFCKKQSETQETDKTIFQSPYIIRWKHIFKLEEVSPYGIIETETVETDSL